ncbi:MAG: C10 family peptidase [Prevotella sp.]|nr:C10 family peptidase [Bacteroides sp.]MCM1367049.1 C10 family peptidase [Prevotella sp.]
MSIFNHFKLLTISLLTSLAANYAIAAPISSQQASVIATQFIKSHNPSTRSLKPLDLKLSYTAKTDNTDAFFIFSDNEAGCFTIVAADTRISPILGYSLSNGFDYNNIPCNIQWWLNEYSAQINAYLNTNPQQTTRAITDTNPRKAIEPLVKTQWDQSTPYNNACPIIDGQHCVTGCVATAMSQVLKYHNWPPSGSGSRDDFSFDRTFDWNNMLDTYLSPQSYNANQAQAVANLMLACGKSVDMKYSPYASGAMAYKMQYALPTYFKYSPGVRHLMRIYYSQAEWDELIYQELLAGRPVIYGGQSPEGGHSFVCDGYSSDGFFHINWGWSGISDGYFRLNALTPSQSGIGGFDGGYNQNQTALVYIQKENGNGVMQQEIVANNAFVYSDDAFIIDSTPNEKGLIYNPLESSIFINVGLKITDTDGNLILNVEDPEGTELEAYYGFPGFTIQFPELSDGKYHLYPIYKTPDSDWSPIKIPYGKQQYVDLEVKNGEFSFSNPGIPQYMTTTLIASDILVSQFPSKNCPVSFRCFINNIGTGDYFGNVSFEIEDAEGNFMMSIPAVINIAAQQSSNISVSQNMDIPVGNYKVYIIDDEQNIISDETPFTVGNTIKPVSYNGNVRPTILGPVFSQGPANTLMLQLRNTTTEPQPFKMTVNLLSPDGKNTISSTSSQTITIPANYNSTINASGYPIFNTPGDWLIEIVDDNGNRMCNPSPLSVVSDPIDVDDVFIALTSNTDGIVSRPQNGEYSDDVNVQNIEGFFNFNGIDGNAFTFASTLKNVTFPPSISHIGAATFYCASQLQSITMQNPVPGTISNHALPTERFSNILLIVPNESANIYKRTSGWSKFSMPGWNLIIDSQISVLEGLSRNDDGEIFNPYFIHPGNSLDFKLLPVPEKVFKITVTLPNGKINEYFSSNGQISLPQISNGLGTVKIELTSAESINSITEFPSAPVYNLSGIQIIKNANKEQIGSLPDGIYIYNGNAILVRH